MGKKAAVRASSLVVSTLIFVVVVLLIAVRPGSALDEAPLPPIGGDVQSVDTEGFYALYRCTGHNSESIDQGYLPDEVYYRYSWADGRMMYHIVGSGTEPIQFEIPRAHATIGLFIGPGPWLPVVGSSYLVIEGWSEDASHHPSIMYQIGYSDLRFEPGPATTPGEHGWEWSVVHYTGDSTSTLDEEDRSDGRDRTTKERIGYSYNAWFHESTGLLLAIDSTQELLQYETNYESFGHPLVRPLGVLRSGECALIDTNLRNLGASLPDVPAAGVLPDGEEPGSDEEGIVGEGPVTDTDETGTDGEDGSEEEEVDPVAQAAAAGATALLAGGWLLAETVSVRRRRDESDAGTVPLSPTGPISSDMTPTEEDRYWDERNRMERAAALRAHQQFADDQWGKFTDGCRERAAADRAAAAAERHDRQLRRTAADRLESMATDKGYRDFVKFMNSPLKTGAILPSWHQLEEMRNGIVKRVGDQAAIDKYYEKSDVRVFLEGCHDTAARGVGKAVGSAHGSVAGRLAEWLVRNPLVPARIGLAVATGGWSELVFLPFDAWDAMETAADQKMAEQNRELTDWEATKQILWTGAWHVGGELVGDGISKIAKMRGGGAAASREAAEEAADAAARRASRRASAQTGDDFIRRVEANLAAKRTLREAGEELPDAATRRAAEALDHGSNPIRAPRDNYVKNWAREGEVIPLNHLHETGYTSRDIRSAGQLCADEGVEIGARTTNIDSMQKIRSEMALPKHVDVKAKTINELDTYLGASEADKGLVGYFEPTNPDPSKVPAELREEVSKRFVERFDEYKKLSQDVDFQKLLNNQTFEIRDGKIFDVATGKPFAGDIDAVFVRDKATGKYLTSGDRFDRVMARWRAKVGGQHGVEMNVVDDIASRYRPGTLQHAAGTEKGLALRGNLQASHTANKEIVCVFGADGVVRRGPIGADINLMPSADEILVDVAESAPAAGSSVPIGGTGASGPPQGTGGAVGSTIGRELEGTPDA